MVDLKLIIAILLSSAGALTIKKDQAVNDPKDLFYNTEMVNALGEIIFENATDGVMKAKAIPEDDDVEIDTILLSSGVALTIKKDQALNDPKDLFNNTEMGNPLGEIIFENATDGVMKAKAIPGDDDIKIDSEFELFRCIYFVLLLVAMMIVLRLSTEYFNLVTRKEKDEEVYEPFADTIRVKLEDDPAF
ncbi:uncharacterized protein [Diabrotica undecimpunctata]|uniref:uncharacterized protein isoform X1 n=1 Tax=Diabrotica undecimpunctata TaxID=50387 RepID=UPI003B6427C6